MLFLGGDDDVNPWEDQIGLNDITEDNSFEDYIESTITVDTQYDDWFEKFGGLSAIGVGVEASDAVYDLGIVTVEVDDGSSAGTKTLIVMLFGILPFFVCLGMYLTSIYLPDTKLGTWLNIKKEALKKKCC